MEDNIYEDKLVFNDSFSWYKKLYWLIDKSIERSLLCEYFNDYYRVHSYFYSLKELHEFIVAYINEHKDHKKILELKKKIYSDLKEAERHKNLNNKPNKIQCIKICKRLEEPLSNLKMLLNTTMKETDLLIKMNQILNPYHAIRGFKG